ncbi:MAG: tetratricopeptide repeat protein [Pleurocapsa sp. MO_226.B13]|nr:tetratricopeptide repeat protein [Pleurocapsa sp. MO_226.B13]
MIKVDEAKICLEQAQRYWQAKHWQLTIEACTKALALDRKIAQAHKLMGDALQKTGQAKEAVGYYLQAIAIQPDLAEVYVNLGSLYANQKQWQQAIDYYQQALRINPELVIVHQHLAKILQLQQQPTQISSTREKYLDRGKILQEQGKLEAALEQYLQAAELTPQSIEVYQEIINLQEQLGLWQDAAKYCRLIWQMSNPDPDLQLDRSKISQSKSETNSETRSQPQTDLAGHHYHLGILHSKQQQWQQAIYHYQQAVSLDSQMSKAYRELARTLAQTGEQEQSLEYWLEAIALESEGISAGEYLELARNLIEQKKYKSAITCYRRAIAIQPDLTEAYLSWGELLTRSGAREQAIACYLQGLRQIQTNPELYYRLGNLYQASQKRSQAAICYQKATQYQPDYAAAHHELGEVLSQQEQWADAIESYRQAIEYNPQFSWSYNNLGYALIQIGQWAEAIPVYQQAIKLNPDFPWSYYNLAEAYGMLGQWEQAVDFYERAAKIQPDLPQIQQKLGDALYQRSQKDRKQALQRFLLAIEQEPNDPKAYHQALTIDKDNLELYLKLGDILLEQGQIDQGIVTYQMALQVQPKNSLVMERLQTALKKKPNRLNSQIQLNYAGSGSELNYSRDEINTLVEELQQSLPRSNSPLVSIIIPVYNQLSYTLNCLRAIASNLDSVTEIEVIVINDCSGDPTSEILELITVITLINNPTNRGFIYSCNHGASVAKGKYLYFLNNDTEIKPNCIESLIAVLEQDEEVGAVGSKLIYPWGSLQEAGGIVGQDASAWNYGRQDNAGAPEYNYMRPVDYCSGASLMVRKAVFAELNGFERDFAPAYYEDTDLCFAIRHQLGLEVIYQPKSEVIHHEGVSSGTSTLSGVKQYQLVNAAKFKQKWQTILNNHYGVKLSTANVPSASRRYLGSKTVLVIDSYVPSYDKESGSRRLFELLKIFKALDFHVIFAADNGDKAEPYTSILQNLQIEVLYTQEGYGIAIEEQIEQRLSLIDLAWIARPELNEKYSALIRQNQSIKVVYDTIDLHYLRLKRAWELAAKNPQTAKEWIEMQAKELNLAHQADLTVTVTSVEQQLLQRQTVDNVVVVPNIHLPYQGNIPGFADRSGILFIGSYNHTPNVDAVLWLCQEIMPLVWQTQPSLKVTLLGSNPTPEVRALESDRITVTGYIEDVTPYFLSHKLSVSPLRYGAGMKGKIGQSLEYSLPVVSTTIGTEGMDLIPEQQILEANTTEDFAQQILLLYNTPELWYKLSSNSQQAIANYSPKQIQQQLSSIVEHLLVSN